jgi:hypothetical protein
VTTWTYHRSDELPDIPLEWRDYADALIDYSTGWTFTVKLVNPATGAAALTKTSGIVGAATSPNVLIQWAAADLNITPGTYLLRLTARRTSDSKDRPYRPDSPPQVRIIADPT